MGDKPKAERADYEYKKEKALNKVAETLEECLGKFHGEEEDRIREDIANYMVGYLGVSYGLHVKRNPGGPNHLALRHSGRNIIVTD